MPTLQLPLADIIDNFKEIGAQTGFTLPQFIAQCVAVTVLFLVLNKFAWKPVRTILEQRRATIEESMANAEQIKKELAQAEATRLAITQKANEQANFIIAEAERTASMVLERRTREATAQAEDILRKARESAVLERDRLMAELKREVGALVIQTTEKLAGKVLTSDDQTRLNDETIAQLNAQKN